jgi:hypothetical protein
METIPRAFGALTESAKTTFGSSTALSSYMIPAIAIIIGLGIIIMLVYVVIESRKKLPATFVKGPIDLYAPKSPLVIDRASTKMHMGGTYTLSFYLRLDAVPDMRLEATPLLTWPGIWNLNYNAAHEELQWLVRQTNGEPEKMPLKVVPLQKWTQITIAFEGRTFDLYVNGTLVKSHTLNNLPPSAASSITIVSGNILGQIACVQLWSRRLTVSEVGANYVDTSDSQGRPFLGPDFVDTLKLPNLFCPGGVCEGAAPTACPSQTWEFPYA